MRITITSDVADVLWKLQQLGAIQPIGWIWEDGRWWPKLKNADGDLDVVRLIVKN